MLIYIIVHDFIKIVGKINCVGVLLKKSKSTRILDISSFTQKRKLCILIEEMRVIASDQNSWGKACFKKNVSTHTSLIS